MEKTIFHEARIVTLQFYFSSACRELFPNPNWLVDLNYDQEYNHFNFAFSHSLEHFLRAALLFVY